MILFQIFLFFLLTTSVVSDLIGWNRLQGSVIRSKATQVQMKQLKSVFDQYLMHLESNSPQKMIKLIQLQKLQYRKYIENSDWLLFSTNL